MHSKGIEAYQHAIAEVGKVYENTPDGESLLQTILVSFSKHFSNPPTSCFEEILQKNFTVEEMRCAMFLPTNDQVRCVNLLHIVGIDTMSFQSLKLLFMLFFSAGIILQSYI